MIGKYCFAFSIFAYNIL